MKTGQPWKAQLAAHNHVSRGVWRSKIYCNIIYFHADLIL